MDSKMGLILMELAGYDEMNELEKEQWERQMQSDLAMSGAWLSLSDASTQEAKDIIEAGKEN
jgi:hypothetical protein